IPFTDVAAASKRVFQSALDIGENRLELLLIEMQEARDCLLRLLILALLMAMFGLLAGITLTIGVVILFWDHSPLAAVAVLGSLYVAAALVLRAQLVQRHREWQLFS